LSPSVISQQSELELAITRHFYFFFLSFAQAIAMSSTKPVTVIIGASRGVGEAFVEQYRAAGHHVVAAMRKPVDMGKDVQVIPIDITSDESVQAAAKLVKEVVSLCLCTSLPLPWIANILRLPLNFFPDRTL
jgi:hypothetical protein